MPRLTANALEPVLRSLYRDRLPPHVEMATQDAITSDAIQIRLLDRACDIYATAEIDRHALRSCGDDAHGYVRMVDHTVGQLIERLLSARAAAVREAIGRVAGGAADAPDVHLTEDGHVLLINPTNGTSVSSYLAGHHVAGLDGWAQDVVRLYWYQCRSQVATAASMRSVLREIYPDTNVSRGEVYAINVNDWGINTPGPTPECEHTYGPARWRPKSHVYCQTCTKCNHPTYVQHYHPEGNPFVSIPDYGEVDITCKVCRADAGKDERVAEVFKRSYPTRFAREVEPEVVQEYQIAYAARLTSGAPQHSLRYERDVEIDDAA